MELQFLESRITKAYLLCQSVKQSASNENNQELFINNIDLFVVFDKNSDKNSHFIQVSRIFLTEHLDILEQQVPHSYYVILTCYC